MKQAIDILVELVSENMCPPAGNCFGVCLQSVDCRANNPITNLSLCHKHWLTWATTKAAERDGEPLAE